MYFKHSLLARRHPSLSYGLTSHHQDLRCGTLLCCRLQQTLWEPFRMVKGIKEIYAERVIFYNHYIQVRTQPDIEIHLLSVIYRENVVTESEKYQINNLGDKWWHNQLPSHHWQVDRTVTVPCPFCIWWDRKRMWKETRVKYLSPTITSPLLWWHLPLSSYKSIPFEASFWGSRKKCFCHINYGKELMSSTEVH